jgi:tetratricopeptide (TPR) repeat protein
MLSRISLFLAVPFVAVALGTATQAAASVCAEPDPSIDLEQRVADCEADLSYVWDRSGFPHLVFNLGRSLRLLGRNEEALPVLHEALRYSPENGYYWAELGRLYLALNEPATAVAMYSQAIVLDGSDPYHPADRAEAWFEFGRADGCVTDLEVALPQLAGWQDEAWFKNLYGRCLNAVDRHADAVAAFDAALAVVPDYVDAMGNRAYALHAAGRYDEVLAATAAMLDPAKVPELSAEWEIGLRALRIEALGFLGRPAEAEADIAALKQRFPDSLDVVNLEAWALFTAGRLDDADRAADVLRNQPDQSLIAAFMIDTIAQIDLALGRIDTALAGLELAAWRDPGLVAGWLPALAAQGYLPQTRLADGVLTAVRRCVAEKGKACSLAPLPATTTEAITVSRPAPVPAPPAEAPVETPVFEPAPADAPAEPPGDLPGLGTAPKPVRPGAPAEAGDAPGLGTAPKPVEPATP